METTSKQTIASNGLTPELIRKVQAGDDDAFSAFYHLSSPTVFRTIRSMVRDEALAQDIQQNTYLRAYRGIKQLENPAAVLPWLRRIAVNEAVTELSRKTPLTFTELAGEDEVELDFPEMRTTYQPERQVDQKENARLVREILETLPEKQQLIVGMYYYEELSVKEIAKSLSIAQGTVTAQLSNGRKRIEAEVRKLEKQGVKLYGLSPMGFLIFLLRNQNPDRLAEKAAVEGILTKTTVLGGKPVTLTAKAVGSGFFHTVAGKVTVAVLTAAMVTGGVLGISALHAQQSTSTGDVRPTESVILSEPMLLDPSEPIPTLIAPTQASTLATEPETEAAFSSEPTPSESRPSVPKPSEPRPSEPKPSEPTPSESRPSVPEPSEPRPSEPKPSETKPSEPKPSEPKPSEPQLTDPAEPQSTMKLTPVPLSGKSNPDGAIYVETENLLQWLKTEENRISEIHEPMTPGNYLQSVLNARTVTEENGQLLVTAELYQTFLFSQEEYDAMVEQGFLVHGNTTYAYHAKEEVSEYAQGFDFGYGTLSTSADSGIPYSIHKAADHYLISFDVDGGCPVRDPVGTYAFYLPGDTPLDGYNAETLGDFVQGLSGSEDHAATLSGVIQYSPYLDAIELYRDGK